MNPRPHHELQRPQEGVHGPCDIVLASSCNVGPKISPKDIVIGGETNLERNE